MNLKATLPEGGQIYISNDGGQTRISLGSSDGGGSQSQASSFSTGDWKGQPKLSKTSGGAALTLEAEDGRFAFTIHGNSIQKAHSAPEGGDAITLEEAGDDEGAPEMKPMEPMKPMKPMS